jgi:hypothetical protein
MGFIRSFQLMSGFSVALPIATAAIRYPRLKTEGKILLLLFLITVFSEIYYNYCQKVGLNYYWLYYLYAPIEYSLIIYVMSHWQENKGLARALQWSIVGFIAICIIDFLITTDLRQMNNWVISLSFMVYALVSSVSLLQLKRSDIGWLSKDMRFWVSAGLLIYSTGGLTYFLFFPLIASAYLVTAWGIYSITNTLSYLLFGMGMLYQCPE